LKSKHDLKPTQLRRRCSARDLGFKTTADLPDLAGPIGQERAMAALTFGVGMQSDGYNVFVLGPSGSGRTSMTKSVLERTAAEQPRPSDWCYVYNFDDPRKPRALELPAGSSCRLRDEIDELIEDLDRELSRAFESEEYSQRRDEILKEYREERGKQLQDLEKEVQTNNFAIGRGPAGFLVAPTKDGEVLTPAEYAALTDEERENLDKRREELQEKLGDILRQAQRREKEARDQVKTLDREVAEFAIGHLIDELKNQYLDYPRVVEHLQQMKQDLVENVAAARDGGGEEEGNEQRPPHAAFQAPSGASPYQLPPFERYKVNVLLTCDCEGGAPVIFEPNPTLDNLTGEIEHTTAMGALVTNFNMIKPGALHRANGGYLIVEADTMLRRPYAYEALKRALKNKEVKAETLQDQLRFISVVTLQPEPIPLNVKVVLIGSAYLYYLMYAYDEDFRKLFKVKADFGGVVNSDAETTIAYAQFVATHCRRENLPPFKANAVAEIVEFAMRQVEDQGKLTARFVDVADLIRESAYWAKQEGVTRAVDAKYVRKAIEQSIWRSNRYEERLLEVLEQGTIVVNVAGEAVGEINGLSILQLGDYMIGKPSRISAKAFSGHAGVLNIDREAKLTGRIHDKGALTLSGFLGDRFAQEQAIKCSITVSFEQLYEEVEGDSASSTELYAVLSALSGVPIKQGWAVTGSVNQMGEVQAIGGVNRKIEGFFALCKTKGLTGEQGVIIPATNMRHLMLQDDVIEAVKAGTFRICAVKAIEEGIELLTGVPAGKRGKDGQYPEGTIYRRVVDRLKAFAQSEKSEEKEEEEETEGKEGAKSAVKEKKERRKA
jgi:lon-related putative ATP-dependent protease